jgi:hypothetical protein
MIEARSFLRPSGLALPLVALMALFSPSVARAQANPVLAESLYEEGKQLFFKKDFATACPKLAESDRLDPAGGTVLMLGECYEGEGKVASARIAFGEAIARAQRDRRIDREKEAKRHLAAIESHVPKYVIEVPDEVRNTAGLVVKSGGVVVPSVSFGIELFADPGTLELTAEAPGYETFRGKLFIKEGAVSRIQIGALARSAPVAPLAESAPPPLAPAKSSMATPVAIAIGGVGLVALGFGGYFGGKAIADTHAVNSQCKGDPTCGNLEAVNLAHTADHEGTAANVLLPIGAVAVAVGIVVLIVANPKANTKAALRFVPNSTFAGSF